MPDLPHANLTGAQCQSCGTPADLLSSTEVIGGWCATCRLDKPRSYQALHGVGWTTPERQRARDLYRSGLTSRQVAVTMERPLSTVRWVLWAKAANRSNATPETS